MKISSYTYGRASDQISALLGRIVFHNRMPITRHQFWQSTWTKNFQEGYDLVMSETASGLRVFSVKASVWAPVMSADQLYCIHLTTNDANSAPFVPYLAVSPAELRAILRPEAYEKMHEWIVRCVDLEGEIRNAYQQTADVLAMVNTAGQLKRMVPDLMRYLPKEYTDAANSQERRSALPHAWASTPREPIYAALNTLAKAALLEEPKRGTGPAEDDHDWKAFSFQKVNWAFKATDTIEVLRSRGWKCTA